MTVEASRRRTSQENWRNAAEKLGWEWNPAYNGYVHPNYHPDGPANQYSSYPSDMAAEDACFIDGVETEADAVRLVTEAVS